VPSVCGAPTGATGKREGTRRPSRAAPGHEREERGCRCAAAPGGRGGCPTTSPAGKAARCFLGSLPHLEFVRTLTERRQARAGGAPRRASGSATRPHPPMASAVRAAEVAAAQQHQRRIVAGRARRADRLGCRPPVTLRHPRVEARAPPASAVLRVSEAIRAWNGPGCWSAWPWATPRCCPGTSKAPSGWP
jgi:hypothetical protein